MNYLHQDHLGSVAVITNESGVVTERLAYDPWGKRRHTDGQSDTADALYGVNTDRGYTMHEHLDEMGIVHMNGRIYDPLIGRFMSADPFIQSPEHLQSYNRYAYVLNNPLAYTDPSGYFSLKKLVRTVVAIAVAYYTGGLASSSYLSSVMAGSTFTIGGSVGLTAGIIGGAAGGFAAGIVSGGGLKSGVQGAFTGSLFGAAGFAGGPGEAGANSAARYLAHAGAGCVSAVAGGGKCGAGASSALFGKFASNQISLPGREATLGEIIGRGGATAVAGGVGSKIAGGKFANGAETAAFGYLFNELLHSAAEARAKYGKGTVGHHWVTFGSTTDLDISAEARAVWGQSTNGMSLPDSVHLPQHGSYNAAVRAELLDWSATNNIDLATMSADDARRFSLHVQSSSHPDISRIVSRINTYHSMPSTSRSLYRGLSAVGASGLVELFYPSPVRAPQCAINPNISGC